VSDKFGTHTKQEQYYSHLFQFCLYVYAKKTKYSGPKWRIYSSNLTTYLSINPKYVHFSHFLRIYMYLCFLHSHTLCWWGCTDTVFLFWF
jgi:hypothetical protein